MMKNLIQAIREDKISKTGGPHRIKKLRKRSIPDDPELMEISTLFQVRKVSVL